MDVTADLRTRLGPTGVWVNFDALPTADVLRFAGEVEALGYGALWVHETLGREPFALLGALAGTTSRIALGLGIASVYARDAAAAHCGARTIADLASGRFVMGLGVSHRSSVGVRGHEYGPPIETMTAYLDAYDGAPWTAVPGAEPPLVLAALGPRMLALAATRNCRAGSPAARAGLAGRRDAQSLFADAEPARGFPAEFSLDGPVGDSYPR